MNIPTCNIENDMHYPNYNNDLTYCSHFSKQMRETRSMGSAIPSTIVKAFKIKKISVAYYIIFLVIVSSALQLGFKNENFYNINSQ